MKKILLIIILILYGCGYQPIYINKNLNNLEFKEIILKGEKDLNSPENNGSSDDDQTGGDFFGVENPITEEGKTEDNLEEKDPEDNKEEEFVIDENGYVITNYHVVQDADEVLVKFLDRKEFRAEVVGMDELSDLALLKIESEDLNPVEIGDSDEVEQGDGVIAIG